MSAQNNNYGEVSDRIATVGGKQKFFDFRDGLVPANEKDYAMLHGAGGSKFAPSSVIKLTITDYSGGTGNGSVTVQSNVSPSLVEILRDKAAANMGTTYVPINDGMWAFVFKTMKNVGKVTTGVSNIKSGLGTLLTGLREAAVAGVNGEGQKNVWTAVGVAVKKSIQALTAKPAGDNAAAAANQQQQQQAPVMAMPIVYDYHYEQTRVNTHKRYQANPSLVSVSVLRITRSGYRQNGEVSKLPWSVNISNFYAAEKKWPNGTSSYDPKTVTDKRDGFFTLTDDDMYKAASRVCHFVEVFEMATCIPLVVAGRAAIANQRSSRSSNRGYNQQPTQPPVRQAPQNNVSYSYSYNAQPARGAFQRTGMQR